jgi:hypothetical protein
VSSWFIVLEALKERAAEASENIPEAKNKPLFSSAFLSVLCG